MLDVELSNGGRRSTTRKHDTRFKSVFVDLVERASADARAKAWRGWLAAACWR